VPTKHRVRTEAGFTLLEVLAAMVILSLGLLSLEALGIGAAKSIALADRTTEFATIASDSLDSALHQLRRDVIPTQFCRTDLKYGDKLSRAVDMSNTQLAKVTVRVIPNASSPNPPKTTFEISSSLFLPTALVGSTTGSPCT
jgi:prepilin-type N-terminal cleavage/methylation domain-containing protein